MAAFLGGNENFLPLPPAFKTYLVYSISGVPQMYVSVYSCTIQIFPYIRFRYTEPKLFQVYWNYTLTMGQRGLLLGSGDEGGGS